MNDNTEMQDLIFYKLEEQVFIADIIQYEFKAIGEARFKLQVKLI